MNDSRTRMTSRLLAGLAVLLAAWVLPVPAFAAHHAKASAASASKAGKHQAKAPAAKKGKAAKAGKADSSEQVCTHKGKGAHKKTVCRPAGKSDDSRSDAPAKSEKVCTRQGKGRHAKTVCKRGGKGDSADSAKSERGRTEKVCTSKGKGRHKKTVCKDVEKSGGAESAKSERVRTEKVCTSKGKGRHKKTVCKTVEKAVAGTGDKAERAETGKTCSATVIRHGRRIRVRKPCASAPSEPLLTNSPIKEGALDQGAKPAAPSAPVKARTAPIRAYAVDGSTFFHNGRKYRVEGLTPEAGEHATQRLQQILDSGPVTVEATSADENGATRAQVRVGGRNVVDLLKQKP
ncbi:hypothetical protein [Niveibacterium terrae]|uniref:hypothetical protein n=1 Tax=Niveibacterium terrae TaxID=3373598 RepID=UPI003A8CC466